MTTYNMDELFSRQNAIIIEVEKIYNNFRKDSASRKNKDYIQRRLQALDNLWGEFQQNDTFLEQYTDDQLEYFGKKIFSEFKNYFEITRSEISSYKPPSTSSEVTFSVPVINTEDADIKPGSPIDNLLSRQRTNFRALQRLIENIDVDKISEKWEIEDELKILQHRWHVIDELHLQIDNILQGGDGFYDGEFQRIERTFKDMKRTLNRKNFSTGHSQKSIPTIEIPTFSGKYEQWPTFCDLFTETIHTNNCLSDTQKMQHLKSKLKGEAERLIQHLNISADNYDTAWELLQHRYNNPQVLFTKQIETFLNQPTLHKQTSFDLKKIYDTTMECIHAIHNLGVDTKTWDPLLVHLVVKKLDLQTYTDYKESRKAPRELPSFDELMGFIESKFIALEPIHKRERENPQIRPVHPPSFKPPYFKTSRQTFKNYQAVRTFTRKCPYCSREHDLYMCKKFQNMTPEVKLQTITKLQVCHNCLYRHLNNKCYSVRRCKECNAAHNTLLHDIITSVAPTPKASESSVHEQSNQLTRSINHVANHDEEILLTTLMLRVRASDNTYMTLRALLDQGSQVSLISENAVQRLGLKRRRCHVSVTGIGVGSKQGKGVVSLDCRSIYNDYNYALQTDALVITDVVNRLPNTTFARQDWPHLQHLNLADPEYNVSKPIDILLDASVYSDIIQDGLRKGPSTAPIAQQTRLGWILSGNVKTFQCNITLKNLPDITKYWELEDISSDIEFSYEDIYCDELFQSTTKRREDGIYEVALPMIPDFHQKLGASKPKAIAQFLQIEKRMSKDKQLSDGYQQFMKEYLDLNHMREVKTNEQSEITCYLPHHGVLKPESSTTSLRVVFNASSKTSSGHSLNDLMYSGPNLQQDLLTLIHKWRQHQYVVTADIEKMFRQIHIRDSDQGLQRILWRDSPRNLLKEYQLTTVTYGMKAAPFLAMRVLKQIGRDNATSSLAASTLEESFYMDDLLTGHHCKATLRALQEELISVLKCAGMNIRKWSSNEPDLLNNLPTEQRDIKHYDFKDSEARKTLGLRWNVTSDSFTFKNKLKNDKIGNTKRSMLSEISQTFDPLGWLSPLTIRAKLLFQKTWCSDISWDTELPHDIQKEWSMLRNDLQHIENYIIPRFIGDMLQKYHVHGFCDASERAYACAVYIVTQKNKGEYISTLVAAKTKVAPRNKQITLPRMELLGALLLSQLMKKLIATLPKDNMQMYAWTDSMIVLGWLHGERIRWKQFVANRVQQITDIIPAISWRHVRSEENAADCATRGLSSDILQNHELWWKGPEWLTNLDEQRLIPQTYENPTIEVKRSNVHAALLENNSSFINQLLFAKSNVSDIIKTICWYLRFITWLRNKESVSLGSITPTEKDKACNLIIKTVQAQDFSSELSSIRDKGYVHKKSNIAGLNPFIDDQGILRVGGRLRNSKMGFSSKHPVILSPRSRFTKLLIYIAHLAMLHGGPQLTLTYLREKYWVINGIRTVKKQLSDCVKCRRYQNTQQQPIMADLPEVRVTPSRPFSNVGVDFTGHVEVKTNKGRGVKTAKGYVAVFVCMSTKAVHLELVSDMSTATFLAAFKRMCARRGTPANIYSDNGTNFVGAAKVLRREHKGILDVINASFDYGTKDMEIRWHFNAPAWPNAGGLWEAAVKSFKHHLKRVLGEQRLTYEEFTTLLYQIEACLNSRPLCQLTEDADDTYLTPGHFLIGGSLISRPQTDPDMVSLPARWQLIQALNKGFWKAWSKDYLQQLQGRTKWRVPCKNLQVGDVVLVKEDNTPPGKWALGRVQELYPGQDGHVRVVTLKVQNSTIKRPVNKLVLLPVTDQMKTNTLDETRNQDKKVDKDKSTVRRRGHFNVCSIFTTLLFLLTFFTRTYSFEVTNLNSSQGLYFDRIANMQLIRSEWKIVTYYDMEPYWEGIRAYRRYSAYLENRCTEIKEQTACDVILVQLQHAFSELEYYNVILKRQNELTRQKRGLIDGVGNIANSLFGVLDNRFAEKYETDISLLKDNQHHLLDLWKNQTSVIEAEYNLLKRTEFSIQKQHKIFNRHMMEMEKNINNVKTDIDRVKYMNQFILSIMSANVMYTHLKNVQDTLIDTVTNIHNGKFNIHLLTPQQLQQELSIISSQLSKDLILPIDNTQTDIQTIYHLLKIKARMTDKYMIFEIRLPLVSRDSYELYKTIPIPYQVKDKMISIVPVSNYIGMNLQKDSYLPVTTEDIEHCLVHESDTFMCYLRKPIFAMRNDKDLCVTHSIDKHECETIKGTCQNKWINLNKINSYFYFCCDDCYLRTFCGAGAQVTTHLLARANIVSISENCIIKTDNFTVYGHSQFENNLNARDNIDKLVIPPINQVFNITVKTSQMYKYNSAELFPSNETYAALEALGEQISKLKSSEHLSDGISYHDVHHYAVIYILIGGMAGTGMIIMCRHFRRRRQHATSTTLPLRTAPGHPAPAPVPRARSLSALHRITHHDDIVPYAETCPVTFKIPVVNDSIPQEEQL